MSVDRAQMIPKDEFSTFVKGWWERRGTRVSRVSQLADLARDFKLLPTLLSKTHGHHTITTLGALLTEAAGSGIEIDGEKTVIRKRMDTRTKSGKYWLYRKQKSGDIRENTEELVRIPKRGGGKLLDLPGIEEGLQAEDGQRFFDAELGTAPVPDPESIPIATNASVRSFSFIVGDVHVEVSEKPTGKEILIKIPGETR